MMHFENLDAAIIMKKKRQRFSPEFKLEAAQLVADQGYSVREAAEALNNNA